MSGNDIAISSTAKIPQVGQLSVKPSHLIILEKNKGIEKFITLDKPEFLDNWVHVKGFFSMSSEEEIILNYREMLTSAKAEVIVEMFFPLHRVNSIRSLVFKAK